MREKPPAKTDIMNAAVSHVFGDDDKVKTVLGLYWRHFFGFFFQ